MDPTKVKLSNPDRYNDFENEVDAVNYALPNGLHPQVIKMCEHPRHEQRSPEWFALRKNRLTASDFASAIGQNKYCSRRKLLFKKCGIEEERSEYDERRYKDATSHGIKYENEALQKYEDAYGKVCLEFGCLPHPSVDWLGGSPDGITSDGVLIEIKCPRNRVITHDIPSYYLPQVQLLLDICDLEVAHFIQYSPEGYPHPKTGEPQPMILDILEIQRDREWFQKVLPKANTFWIDVMHYREHGIHTHPYYKKMTEKKEKKLGSSSRSTPSIVYLHERPVSFNMTDTTMFMIRPDDDQNILGSDTKRIENPEFLSNTQPKSEVKTDKRQRKITGFMIRNE